MAKAIKSSKSPVVDQFGRSFRPGDIIFSANFEYVPYVVHGVDQDQGVIFIHRLGADNGHTFRCTKPRWFQIFKKPVNNF